MKCSTLLVSSMKPFYVDYLADFGGEFHDLRNDSLLPSAWIQAVTFNLRP